jgi:oxygen-independent coproporphyrinogen-3 oxidase
MRPKSIKQMGIYIHIPFCKKKCNYCDFLSFVQKEEIREQYVCALLQEIEQWSHVYGKNGKNDTVTSIYFGGGTPSILSVDQIVWIMNTLKEHYNIEETAEITMECNPGTVNFEKLCGFKEAGIKRLSIGLQSADDVQLEALGRIHTFAEFKECYEAARSAGFDNISVDVISAIPGQDMESLEDTLGKIVGLEPKPEHISAYSLIIEENTKFYELYEQDKLELPSEDMERKMYYYIRDYLKQYGYERYEISNFALPGKEAVHNSSYWSRDNYLGLGLGASSFMDETRWMNSSELMEYIEHFTSEKKFEMKHEFEITQADMFTFCENVEHLTKEEQMEEYIFLGLRRKNGISVKAYNQIFGENLYELHGKKIKKLLTEGFLKEEKDCLMLTDKGIDVSNEIFAEILL